uniref:Uncharacterized protein n=1 Tax=Arundo donax TaxID=35708 RepID=A0A0A8ZJK6_ARUDO
MDVNLYQEFVEFSANGLSPLHCEAIREFPSRPLPLQEQSEESMAHLRSF